MEKINKLVRDIIVDPKLMMFNPAGNLSDAWRVLEKLGERYDCAVERYADDGTYSASFYESESSRCEAEAAASTAPMAICLAALKLVGVEVEHS